MAISEVITPVSSEYTDGTVVRSLSVAITAGDGNLCLVVHVGGKNADANDDVTSVTWKAAGGDQSLTEVAETKNGNENYAGTWRLVNPDVETANVDVAFDQTPTTPFAEGVAVIATVWDNVDQTTPFTGTVTTETGTSANSSVSRTDAVDTDYVIDALSCEIGSITVGASQTDKQQALTGEGEVFATSYQLGSVSGDVMSWTFASGAHAHHALRMQNDDAGGGALLLIDHYRRQKHWG